MKNIFGKDLRESRKRINLKQEDLSKLTGLSVTSISKYEHGERLPRYENAKKLAEILDLDLSKYYLQESLSLDNIKKNFFKSQPPIEEVDEDSLDMDPPQFIYHQNLLELFSLLMSLNTDGLKKVIQYSEDLVETHKYEFK